MSSPASYNWSVAYESALLETDTSKLREKLIIAEHQIVERLRILARNHGGTVEERNSIINALTTIKTLRIEMNQQRLY